MTMKLIIPAYFAPDLGAGRDSKWQRVLDASEQVFSVIINPNSGPGKAFEPAYKGLADALQKRGIGVFGYVHTSYGKRPPTEVLDEALRFKEWYNTDGIFLDEVATTPEQYDYYSHLGQALDWRIYLNPGTKVVDNRFYALASVLCTFEGTWDNYRREWSKTVSEGRRVWHIVYECPMPFVMRRTLTEAALNGVGYVWVTNDKEPNPFDSLPAYWDKLLSYLR